MNHASYINYEIQFIVKNLAPNPHKIYSFLLSSLQLVSLKRMLTLMLPDELQLKLGITRGPFSVMEQLNSLKLRLHGLVLAKLLGGVDLHGEIEWVMWWANAEQPQQVE